MDLSFSDLNLQPDGLPHINYNSIETLPGFAARDAFIGNQFECDLSFSFSAADLSKLSGFFVT